MNRDGRRRRTHALHLLLIVPLLSGAACRGGPQAETAVSAETGAVSAVDDAGREVWLPAPALRIVSLVPSSSETLVAMGATELIVGRTDYDDNPELSHLPSLGGGLTPNLELLASLRPDLVVAWEEAGAARIRSRLGALGIPVFAVQTRDTAQVFATVRSLGQLTGRDRAAQALEARVRRQLEEVRASVAARPRPSVLYLISLDPPMAAGPHLFIGELLELAGGRNIFEDLTVPSPQVSLEEIVRRRPAIVLIPGPLGGAEAIERLTGGQGWRALVAAGTRFHTLPPDILHRPGPSIAAASRALRAAIHPDLADGP